MLLPLLLAPAIGVQYAPLIARFTGDLSAETTFAQSVQIKTLYVDAATLPLRGYFSIDVMWTGTRHTGTRFAYPANSDLDVLGFMFRGNLCWTPDGPLDVCLGLGNGTVNVNAAKDRRDWGTWNYQLQVDYALGDTLGVFALGQYIGEAEQEIDGVAASFTMLTAGGGLSATW